MKRLLSERPSVKRSARQRVNFNPKSSELLPSVLIKFVGVIAFVLGAYTPVAQAMMIDDIANQSVSNILSSTLVAKADSGESLIGSDRSTEKLEFEPVPDLSTITGVIKPSQGESSTNVFAAIKPLQLLAMDTLKSTANQTSSQASVSQDSDRKPDSTQDLRLDEQKIKKISSQLIENLESGIEAIATGISNNVAPELPSLIAKVYLPETSDYGLSTGFVWPARGLMTSGFGWRWGRLHQGIDIAAPVGTPIWAVANGTIDFAGWNNGGYGNMIDILHSDGTITRYGHLSAIYVKKGQPVSQSQVIAAMGNTGFSTGPHLHFEIRPNGRAAINPMTLLARAVTRG